jgi:hypothetical protein
MQSEDDGLTNSHVCSIRHSEVILVTCGRLGEIFEMPLLPLRGSNVSCMFAYSNDAFHALPIK